MTGQHVYLPEHRFQNETPYEFILVRYGELTLKGKNRKQFEQRLIQHLKLKLKDLQVQVESTYDRIYVYLNDEPVAEVARRLDEVFGISSYSPAVRADLDLEQIQHKALQSIQQIRPFPATFKVSTKRANKAFAYDSPQLNHLVGSYILRHTDGLTVDVHQPEVELTLEIRHQAAYIMSAKYQAAGGLPVGSSGKGMLMLSGGIDSPVAGYLCMKRGLRLEAVHFHSFPFTSERAQQKVIDLTQQLSRFCGRMKLHMVPFTDIQTEIRSKIPEEYSITVMRRMMLRIVEKLAETNQALSIITGDNLGQVASQTMESLHTINAVTNMPLLRPLITMDKNEIITLAKQIDTYETSILPYEDCCTVFQPKSPKTKPSRRMTETIEKSLDVDKLVGEAVHKTEYTTHTADEHFFQ